MIIRPVIVIMAAFVLGEASSFFGIESATLIATLITLITVKIITKKQAGFFVVVFFSLLSGIAVMSNHLSDKEYANNIEGEVVYVSGVVSNVEEHDDCKSVSLLNVTVKCKNEERRLFGVKSVIKDENVNPKEGCMLYIKGEAKGFKKADNFGNFDYKDYYGSLGIFLNISAEETALGKKEDIALYYAGRIRRKVMTMLDASMDDCFRKEDKSGANLLALLVTGFGKAKVRDEIDMYSSLGVSHIFTISGFHITMAAAGAFFIFKRFMRKDVAFSMSALAGGFYCLFTGCGIAAIRAVVCYTIRDLSVVTGRKYDDRISLILAVFVILIECPTGFDNPGFILSLTANCALIFGKRVKVNNQKVFTAFFMASAMGPVLSFYYYEIPMLSALFNLVLAPVFIAVIYLSWIGIIVPGYLGKMLLLLSAKILGGITGLSSSVAEMGFAKLCTGKPEMMKEVLVYAVLLTVTIILMSRRKVRNIAAISVVFAAFVFSSFFLKTDHNDNMVVSFISVGQGDCAFIRFGDDTTVMIDSGSSTVKNVARSKVVPNVKALGYNYIDYVFLSHPDEDHVSGIKEMIENHLIKIRFLVFSGIKTESEEYRKIEMLAKENGIDVLYINKGDEFRFDETTIRCISPKKGETFDDINDSSNVLDIRYKNFKMLFTGDISSEVEKEISMDLKDNYDVLKVAHHGSKYSSCSEFLSKCKPKLSVVSVGENNKYGHPSKEALSRIEEAKSYIFRTDKEGGLILECDGDGVYYFP